MLAVGTATVPPLPVCALISAREVAVIAVRMVSFDDPLIVIADFRLVPDVVIGVVGIVDAIADTYSWYVRRRQTSRNF